MTRSADAWPRSRASASSSSSRPWYRCQRATHASLTLQTKLPSTCTATWPRRVALSAVTTGTTGALKDLAGDRVDALGRDRLGGRRRDGRCGADRHQREPRLLADLQLDGVCHVGVLPEAVSYTHLRAHETRHDLVCRLLL